MTDEQKKKLKKELREMGVDEEAAMEELGLGQDNTSQKTSRSSVVGKGLASDFRGVQGFKNLLDIASLGETFGAGQAQGQFDESLTIGPTLTDEFEETLNNIAQEMGMDADTMIGELGLVKRDDDELQEYLYTVGIPPDKYYELPWLDKLSIESEHLNLYNGYFMENGMFTPTLHILDHSGFGDGYSLDDEFGTDPWDEFRYIQDNYHGAQYLSPFKLVTADVKDRGDLRKKPNSELCGQLAVIAALGLDIKEGMNIFAELELNIGDRSLYKELYEKVLLEKYPGEDILIEKGFDILKFDLPTTYNTMKNFIEAAGGAQIKATLYRDEKNEKSPLTTAQAFEEKLNAGEKVLALVNIDTSREGQLLDVNRAGQDAAHWVCVQDIITTKENQTLVRVYNPYMNQEQVYDWETFSGAMGVTYNNSTNVAISISGVEQ
jgi:hypothetical protein